MGTSWLVAISAITIATFVAPFVIYAQQHAARRLPSPDEWFHAQGHNHGPWRELDIGILVYQPFLILIPLTLVTGVLVAGYCRSVPVLVGTATLILVQGVALWLHVKFLFWTVD